MTAEESLLERAREILRRAPLVDGHNDVLWELRTKVAYDFDQLDLASPRPELMTDVPRIRAGGLGGQFWSVAGAQDSRWSITDLDQLKTVPASAFEVVQLGAVHSGQ